MATRAQTQRRNRQALLTAAIDLIAAQGYRAATLEAIAARADLSTGAVYSCFGSKRELFHAAITLCRDELLSNLPLPPRDSAAQTLQRFGTAMAAVAAAPDFRRLYLFELELNALALNDQAFAEQLHRDGDPLVDALAAALVGRPNSQGTILDERPARRIATSAAALARGLLHSSLWRDAPIDARLLADACSALANLPSAHTNAKG